jgi:protoheme IX farnesyltransferase
VSNVATPVRHTLTAERLPWRSLVSARLADYAQLVKPRISLMVLLTVSVGYYLAADGSEAAAPLWVAWIGIALVAASSSALNQWWEQDYDARMQRTFDRPLPSGRLSPAEVVAFGVVWGVAGVAWLVLCINWQTALLTAVAWALYVLVYTPLKSRSLLCTTIGAIPGALPPVLGWVAGGRNLDGGAAALFALLYLWQFPHFLSIAWLYQGDYAGAGLKMLPTGRYADRIVGLSAVAYSLCLTAVCLWPTALGLAGSTYGACAALISLLYVAASARFAWKPERTTARGLLAVSLVHLPLVLLILSWDHWRGLQGF